MIIHTNKWKWGESVDIIMFDGAGFVSLSFDDSNPYVCYVAELSVTPKCRKRGYARILMQEAERICKERKIFRIDLNSITEPFVVDFYHKIGFKDIREEDGLVRMYKKLKD